MNEIFNNLPTIEEKIAYLKDNGIPLPDIEKYNSEWDENKHRIMTDLYAYPDRIVEDEYEDEYGEKRTETRLQKLNRIPLAYQKEIVSIAVSFLFGNPVKYTNNLEDESMYDAFQAVLNKEKIMFVDREIAKANGRFSQCAELWWVSEEPNNYYGFNSNYRLRCNLLTPDKNKLYPYFSDQGDMIGFFREYERREGSNKVTYYELYTAERTAVLRDTKDGIQVVSDTVNPIGKIALVFYQFDGVEWQAVQPAIERLEEIASDKGEVNKKFSSPILGLHGSVDGSFTKDRSGKVLQFSGENSRAEFIQPPNASQSLTDEEESLEKIIYKLTQSINISPEALAGMGNMLATENAAFLFMLPHLKVAEKMSVYVPALKRRSSIIKSFLQLMNPAFRNAELDVEPVITPYIINNESSFYRMLMEINGNQPLFSQKATMERAGIKDVDQMQEELREEQELRMSGDMI